MAWVDGLEKAQPCGEAMTLLLSISDLKLYLTCPQKFAYQYVQRRGSDKASKSLVFGSTVHKALELRMQGKSTEGMDWDADFARLIPADQAYVDNKMTAMLPAIEAWTPPVDWEVLHTEHELRVPDRITPVTLCGRADLVVRSMGHIWHVQYKTIDPTFAEGIFLEGQKTDWHECFYQHALMQEYPNEPFGGTLLVLIRKLANRDLKAGENPFTYYPLFRPPSLVVEAMADIWKTAREAHKAVVYGPTGMRWSKYRHACTAYNTLCPFKRVCDGAGNIEEFPVKEPRYA